MDIVNTLTLRHIKNHKKRSILTILAIIVSVSMVTAVFTSAISFVKYFKNACIAVDGNWHASFHDDDYSLHKAYFATDENIALFGARAFYGSTDFGKSSYHSANVFFAEKNWFEMRNVTVSEGRLPQNSGEMLITKSVIDDLGLDVKIGDKITIPFIPANAPATDIQFEIVGISESKVTATDNSAIFVGFDETALKEGTDLIVLARYDKLDNSIWEKIDDTAKSAKIKGSYGNNNELFAYSGIIKNNTILYSLGGFAGILLLIIAVVSVFMIYDSFAVSYQERAKYLGMLASVGATKRQKRKSIYFEALILGMIGIPIGILSGIVGISITFKCVEKAFLSTLAVSYDGALKVYVNGIVIVGTIIASAVTIFVSAYIPARKASKTTAIDAIRQANAVKVKKAKKLRTSKLVSKIFGYEGALAVKNFKRNRKRSRNIVFALSLSVIVFLTVSNFSIMLSEAMQMNYISSPDIIVGTSFADRQKIQEAVSKNKNIERSFTETFQYQKLDRKYFNEDYTDYNVVLVFLDNTSFDNYLKQLGEKPSDYHNKNTPSAILYNSVIRSDGDKKFTYEPIKDIGGQTIPLKMIYEYTDAGESVGNTESIKIGIQTTKKWNEETSQMIYYEFPMFILSEDFIDVFFGDEDGAPLVTKISVICENYEEVSKELEKDIRNSYDNLDFFVDTPNMAFQQMNNFLMVGKVFIYGFITLITVISIMNIINTISNSMNERRREFAMIRSVGMTPKSFKRMIYLEALRYGAKALLFSFPISILIHYGMYKALSQSMDFGFKIQVIPYLVSAVAVFGIIGISLLYSIDKIRNDNIIETLKTDIN